MNKEIYNTVIQAIRDYDLAKERLQKAEDTYQSAIHLPSFLYMKAEAMEATRKEFESAQLAFAMLGTDLTV